MSAERSDASRESNPAAISSKTTAGWFAGDPCLPIAGNPRQNRTTATPSTPIKEAAKYLTTILALIIAAMGLSWCAVYSFWLAARLFHSVAAVRFFDAVGSIILLPVRLLFWLAGNTVDQSTPLTDPLHYATINAVLLGLIAYVCSRRWIFGKTPTQKP